MATIPQRELRNSISEILRRAEAGERFVVTVGGRPVAELGPHQRRRWVSGERLRSLAAAPSPSGLIEDLRTLGPSVPVDPFDA